jgi:hypothetical protein
MPCCSLPGRVAILALGLACAWLGSSPAHAQELQPPPRHTLVELSLGMGAYFFKVEQLFFDNADEDDRATREQAQGAAFGFHLGMLFGWSVHPQLRLGVAWEFGATKPAPTEVNSRQPAYFFLTGPALRYASDERSGFTAQLRLSIGGIRPIGWALAGSLGAGYALPYGRSSAFTFGVDFKVAHAQLELYGEDAGDYKDSAWMLVPSGVLSVLL